MKYSFALVALFAGYAAAQSACTIQCSTTAAADNCDGATFSDPACACENTDFQQATLACIQSTCPEEEEAAVALQGQLCGTSGSGTASASEPVETEPATETDSEAPETGTASAPVSSAAPTSRSVGASSAAATTPRASSAAGSSGAASRTSSVAAATSSAAANAAGAPAVYHLATAGTWAAVALGGAIVAQYAL